MYLSRAVLSFSVGFLSSSILLGHLQLHQVGLVMLLIYCYCREFVAWNSLAGKLTFGRHFFYYIMSLSVFELWNLFAMNPHLPVVVAIAWVFSVDLIEFASIAELTVLRLIALL